MSQLNKFVKILDKLGVIAPPFHLTHWRWWRLAALVLTDIVLICFSYWSAFVLRLDSIDLAEHQNAFLVTMPMVILIHISTFLFAGMYRQVWRYANYNSAILIAKCVMIGVLLSVLGNFLLARDAMPPRSVPVIFMLMLIILLMLMRFSWRFWASLQVILSSSSKERCLIYGAGSAGDLLARHIAANPNFPFSCVGFIDDDANKFGRLIHGLRILGAGKDLAAVTEKHKIKTILLAMHSPSGKVIREIVNLCISANIRPLIMPDMANAIRQETVQPRPIDINDLLRRSPKSTDKVRVKRLFSNQCALITGAGGSIGSEICRQVLECRPSKLILLDSSEFNLYKIDQELKELGVTGVEIIPVLGSVADRRTVKYVFSEHRPSIVLHAAAYKHVPMVESNPVEGVINNILGTKNVAESAVEFQVRHFLLVSTDKAVRPANVMGSTKRCCEILVQAMHALHGSSTSFCAVRFGNVLGSSGSVIPRFLKQIETGGPVTVTHPDVTRFFMLTSEAVGLVLQSIAMSRGGEIFVLDMGEPVKIYDMARHLIQLAGKEPGKDIKIEISGLRPGEKLYEELILDTAENHTLHDDVYIARPHSFDPEDSIEVISKIIDLAVRGDRTACIRLLGKLANSSDPESETKKECPDTPEMLTH